HAGDEIGLGFTGDSNELKRGRSWVAEGTGQVEKSPKGELAADRGDGEQSWVETRSEKEGDVQLRQSAAQDGGKGLGRHSQRGQDVGTPGVPRSGAVAVLDDRDATGCDYDRRGCRDVHSPCPVTPRAASIE